MIYDHQVLKLTQSFYDKYPNPPFTEIETKESRKYNCLLIQSHYDYFICIPFRSRVNHKYAYHFKNSARSKRGKSALDYSKAIIITNTDFLDSKPGIIDNDEYTEMMKNIDKIAVKAMEYVDDYVEYFKSETHISTEEFNRRYRYSSLQYFHKELNIE